MIKRTLERVIKDVAGGRFALTFTMSEQDGKLADFSEQPIAGALAKACDVIQRMIFQTPDPNGHPHPRDTALFERASDRALVRIACSAEDLPKLEPRFRVLSGAYDDKGRLLPTFWTLPLIPVGEPSFLFDPAIEKEVDAQDEVCSCKDPRPLVPGATCRRCHRPTRTDLVIGRNIRIATAVVAKPGAGFHDVVAEALHLRDLSHQSKIAEAFKPDLVMIYDGHAVPIGPQTTASDLAAEIGI